MNNRRVILIPVIGALPDGPSGQDCSIAIPVRNYTELTASPCSELSSPIKPPSHEGTGGGNQPAFCGEGSSSAPEPAGGLRDTVHCPCPPREGRAFFCIVMQRAAGSQLTVLIGAAPGSIGSSTERPPCEVIGEDSRCVPGPDSGFPFLRHANW